MTTFSEIHPEGGRHDSVIPPKVQLIDARSPNSVFMVPEDEVDYYRRKLMNGNRRIFFTIEEYKHVIGQDFTPPLLVGQETAPGHVEPIPALWESYEETDEAIQGEDDGQVDEPVDPPEFFNGVHSNNGLEVDIDLPPVADERMMERKFTEGAKRRIERRQRQKPTDQQVEVQISMLEQQVAMMQQTLANLRASLNQ